jgi:mannose-6-phosphate isomerase
MQVLRLKMNLNNMKSAGSIFLEIQTDLEAKGFKFERVDFNRPWGGFFVIHESQAKLFLETYYREDDSLSLTKGGLISPKILVVLPQKRLSWQYHHRRSEVWKLIEGEAGVIKSMTDEEGAIKVLAVGEKIILQQGERHRLVGLDNIGMIAEIWQHTDQSHPSDENDIVRLQDDFNRKS